MILSREWDATLGGSMQMDLSYATIPVGAQDHITLYNKPKRKEHIERPDYGDSQSNYDFVNPCFLQDWVTLPFAEEDNINEVIWVEGGGSQNPPDNHKEGIWSCQNSHTR
jgi:hypothetical protein